MKKVLIVEDEEVLRNVYTTLFTLEKFNVHTASNGQKALEKLKTVQPDIIVLDLLMPVMGGLEFLKASKISQNYPNTRVLVLSNLSDPATINKITKLGASKYLLKASVSPAELIGAVRQLLAGKSQKQG